MEEEKREVGDVNESVNPVDLNQGNEKETEDKIIDEKEVEKEWAEALELDSWPPKHPDSREFSQEPPAIPEDAKVEPPVESPVLTPEPPVAPVPPVKASAPMSEPMPSTYLVWSVLAAVLCCLIPGIVAVVYSTKVSTCYYAKDFDGAKKASDMAQYWIIASIVVGLIVQTVYIPLMFFV